MTVSGESQYRRMIDDRANWMWDRYKDSTSRDLLADLRRNQQAGRYLVAGDIAAIRASLEPGQQVKDLGKAGLRRILDARFEWVAHEQRSA